MYLKLFVLIFVFKILHILSFSSSNFDESMNVHTRVIKPHHVHVTSSNSCVFVCVLVCVPLVTGFMIRTSARHLRPVGFAWRDLYRATPAVTQDFGFCGLIRRTALYLVARRLVIYTYPDPHN